MLRAVVLVVFGLGVVSAAVTVETEVSTLREGDVISLTCRTESDTIVRWYRNGMLIIAGGRVQMGPSDRTLRIQDATRSDSGVYVCQDFFDFFNEDSVRIEVTSVPGSRNVSIMYPASDPTRVAVSGSLTLRCQGDGFDPLAWSLSGRELSTSLASGLIITEADDLLNNKRTSMLNQMRYDGVTAVYRCHDRDDVESADEITVMAAEPFLVDEEQDLCPGENDDDIKIAFSGFSSATYQMSSDYETVLLNQIHINVGCGLSLNTSTTAPAMFTAFVKGAYAFQVITNAESDDVIPLVLKHNAREVMTTGARGHVGTNAVILSLEATDVVTLKVPPASPGLLARLTGGVFSAAPPVTRVTFTGHLLYRL